MNDPRLEIADPQAYIEMITRHVGEKDPLDVLAETPHHLASLIDSHPLDCFTRTVESGWNPSQVIGHLIDTEFVFGFRLRLISSENEPQILGMDQDLWVDAQNYAQRSPRELLEDFRGARRANLHAWRQVPDSALERQGHHSQRGAETLRTMRKMQAGHDLHHLAQLERLCAQP